MRAVRFIAFAAFLSAGGAPAWAFGLPDAGQTMPSQHQLDVKYGQSQAQPYAMNYSDEAAQSLGVVDGRWDAFDTRSSDPLMPSLKGGVDNGGAMLKLQWHPGE